MEYNPNIKYSTMKKKDTEKTQVSFEEALENLESVVAKMEEGRLPLEEMMKSFEEGNKLAKICSAKLKEIEKKIEVLVGKNGADGKGEWTDFPPEGKQAAVEKNDDGNGIENTVEKSSLF
jgi:exodeoxyribonuclease VII small subunit